MTSPPEPAPQPSLDEIIASYDGEDRELRTMIEQRAQIVAVIVHPGFTALRDYVESVINRKSEAIIMGSVKDHETYVHETAWCQGAHFAFKALESIENLIAVRIAEQPGYDQLDEYDRQAAYAQTPADDS